MTKRGAGSETETALAGFPHHSSNTYLPKRVKAGMRVAICDQLEDPKMTKTIVKRGVTELVTPGVALNDEVLEGVLVLETYTDFSRSGTVYFTALFRFSAGFIFQDKGYESKFLYAGYGYFDRNR